MTTSGSYSHELNTIEIIELATRIVGGIADGQTLTNEQIDTGKKFLNVIAKALKSDNIILWEERLITVPIQASSVVLGSDGFDYKCIRNHDSSASNEPGVGNEYASFWEKLTTSVAAPWVVDTSYVSSNNYFLNQYVTDVTKGRLKQISSTSNQPLRKISQEDYFNLSNPNTLGTPDQYYFRRDFTPEIFVYPFPESTDQYVLEFWVQQYPQDFINNVDTPDFLQDWNLALVDILAYRLAPVYGIFGGQYDRLKARAEDSEMRARRLDHETGDVSFSPNLRFVGGP